MSFWTSAYGTITVSVPGISQAHKEFIIKTVLDHLPKVTGSEGDMEVYLNKKQGYNTSCSHDELEQWRDGGIEMQDYYLITISFGFRDRFFEQTLREFTEWLCRLSKRVWLVDILVSVDGYDKRYVFDNPDVYNDMYEFGDGDEIPNWNEWMFPDFVPGSRMPLKYAYRMYADPIIDDEIDRRDEWEKKAREEFRGG